MTDKINPNEHQPGEKPEGKFHYNPGNQSGKTVEPIDPDSKQDNSPEVERKA